MITEGKWVTKEEVDFHIGIYSESNAECIAIVWHTDLFDADDNAKLIASAPTLKQQRDDLIALIWKQNPKHRHDHDYFHNDCTLCGMEKLCYEKIKAAIAKCDS